MTRPYHSPSSLAKGSRCRRAWAYRYLAGIKEPEVTWSEIQAGAEHTSRQRSTALGKAMHAIGEAWYLGRPIDWQSEPAKIFQSGTHLLPHPNECQAWVEQPIGDVPVTGVDDHAPPVALEFDGVRFAGFKDLVAIPTLGEARRLGLASWAYRGTPERVPLLIDYKSSADPRKYALDEVGLLGDVAANLYALDVMRRTGLSRVPARWVYFQTKRKRHAQHTTVTIEKCEAERRLEPWAALARELDALPLDDPDAAPQNPLACGDYGGCPYHVSSGGPCNARRSVSAIAQVRVNNRSKGKIMGFKGLTEEQKNAFKAQATAPAAETPAPAAEAPAPAAPKPRTRRGRKPAASAPAPSGVAATVAELSAELTAAQAERDAADAKVAAIVTKLREAIDG